MHDAEQVNDGWAPISIYLAWEVRRQRQGVIEDGPQVRIRLRQFFM